LFGVDDDGRVVAMFDPLFELHRLALQKAERNALLAACSI
jgi:hypothetical protein